jgi:hypothetical protein
LKAELLRELARIELLLQQIDDVEAERDVSIEADADRRPSPVALLARINAIGPQIGAVLYHEGLYRSFANRRDVAAYAGLVPTPWRNGSIDREQGISKAGNRRLRHIMIELAWLWARHQPDSALSSWFRARADPADHDCRAGPQTADRALALRDTGRSAGGGCVESGLIQRATSKENPQPSAREADPCRISASGSDKSWLQDAAIKIGSALPSPMTSCMGILVPAPEL